jgi:hypothetical protein
MTTTFIGTHISNSMLIYYIFAFIFSFITVIFAWSLTWDVLLWFIRENRSTLIVLIIFAAINPIIKLIVTKIIVAKDHIVYRYCWAAFELYEILSQVVAGVAKSITRFVLVLVGVFISLPRIDRSPFPAWIEYYLLLDSGSKSYQAMSAWRRAATQSPLVLLLPPCSPSAPLLLTVRCPLSVGLTTACVQS